MSKAGSLALCIASALMVSLDMVVLIMTNILITIYFNYAEHLNYDIHVKAQYRQDISKSYKLCAAGQFRALF